jgi:uncharacterized protein YqiB (DUF1249 family)
VAQFTPVNTAVCLEKLCESNYRKLLRLIPHLSTLSQQAIAESSDKPPLQLTVLDRNPFTLTLLMQYQFEDTPSLNLAPSVTLRIYLDAQLVEALGDTARPALQRGHLDYADAKAVRDYKWRLNVFLEKWLDHCLQSHYCFAQSAALNHLP